MLCGVIGLNPILSLSQFLGGMNNARNPNPEESQGRLV